MMPIKSSTLRLALGTCLAALAVPAGAADLLGTTVTTVLLFPTPDNQFKPPFVATVGDQVEYPGGFADAPGLLDIGANQLTYVSQYGGQYGTGEVNRYVLTFSGLGNRVITSFSLNGSSTFAPRLSGFSSNSVFFDVAGQFPENGTAVYDIGVAAVPEPASWALMIGGFGLVGAAARRRVAVRAALA